MLYINKNKGLLLSKKGSNIFVIKGGDLWVDGYTFKFDGNLPYNWTPVSFKHYLNLIKDVV